VAQCSARPIAKAPSQKKKRTKKRWRTEDGGRSVVFTQDRNFLAHVFLADFEIHSPRNAETHKKKLANKTAPKKKVVCFNKIPPSVCLVKGCRKVFGDFLMLFLNSPCREKSPQNSAH
jgi:hypothetical protein